ncbi:MAG: DUF2953 domain-containing protein [Clostridia bacterium]|nr:DUF2953 domain-containing protein [Clostridia bacterium]
MWLVVVGIILAIFLLLVLSPLKVFVVASESFLIKVKFLFFNIYTFDSNIKKEAEKAVKEKNDVHSTITKITNQTNNYDKLVTLVNILKSVLSKFAKLLKHTTLKNFNFNIVVAGSEAADTAIKYGKICSAVYPLSTFLSKCVNFKPESISVYSDFSGNDTNYNLSFLLYVRIIYLIRFAVSSVLDILYLRIGVKSK